MDDFTKMSDKDFEGYLMNQGLEGGGLDFDAMNPEAKARLLQYMQSEDKPQGGQNYKMSGQNAAMGISQGQAPNMSQPQITSLPGLMSMATQGLQRIQNKPIGLMGK